MKRIKEWFRKKLFKWLKPIILEVIQDKVEQELKTDLFKSYKNYMTDLEEIYDDCKDYLSRVTVERVIEEFLQDSRYIDSINNVVNANLSVESFRFDQKMRLSQMRATKSYDSTMALVSKLLLDIIENYMVKQYRQQEGGIFKSIVIYADDKVKDMNNIYNIFVKVTAPELISEDLAAFYNVFDLNTKEFFIGRFIAPLYEQKLAQLINTYKDYVDRITYKNEPSPSNTMSSTVTKTELENTIDEILQREE